MAKSRRSRKLAPRRKTKRSRRSRSRRSRARRTIKGGGESSGRTEVKTHFDSTITKVDCILTNMLPRSKKDTVMAKILEIKTTSLSKLKGVDDTASRNKAIKDDFDKQIKEVIDTIPMLSQTERCPDAAKRTAYIEEVRALKAKEEGKMFGKNKNAIANYQKQIDDFPSKFKKDNCDISDNKRQVDYMYTSEKCIPQ